MTALLRSLGLAIVWAAATGRFTAVNLALGFALGFLALRLEWPVAGVGRGIRRGGRMIGLALFFARELVASGLRVAYHVVTPAHRMRPGVVAVPLAARTDGEITLLANLISLTPGSLSLDVSSDRSTLYVHVMWMVDPQTTRRSIKDGYERRLLEVLR